MKAITYVVRIRSSLDFGQIAAGLGELGEVENLFIKGTDSDAPNGETSRYKVKRTYSPEALTKLRDMNSRRSAERAEQIVKTLADILRNNAHAPLVKLVQLMNATDVRPNPRGQPWTERSLAKHLDQALARVTQPGAGQISG